MRCRFHRDTIIPSPLCAPAVIPSPLGAPAPLHASSNPGLRKDIWLHHILAVTAFLIVLNTVRRCRQDPQPYTRLLEEMQTGPSTLHPTP